MNYVVRAALNFLATLIVGECIVMAISSWGATPPRYSGSSSPSAPVADRQSTDAHGEAARERRPYRFVGSIEGCHSVVESAANDGARVPSRIGGEIP